MDNRTMLEKLVNILEKQTISNDKMLNAPDNAKITEENKQFAENIRDKIIPKVEQPVQQPVQQSIPNRQKVLFSSKRRVRKI